MKRFFAVPAGVLLFAIQSQALFENGGFENGLNGWNLSGDGTVIASFTPQFTTNDNWLTNQVTSAFYGDHMLMLGTGDIGNVLNDNGRSGTLTSTAAQSTVTQADLDNGAMLYFKWTALLEEPTNGVLHTDAQQPFFSVGLAHDGTSLYHADHRANQPGFVAVGTSASGDDGTIWLGSGIAEISLDGLAVGDVVDLSLFVKDCALGGHGGLVFLDGFGTTRPPDSVPEPGLISLLGFGLLSLAGLKFRRR